MGYRQANLHLLHSYRRVFGSFGCFRQFLRDSNCGTASFNQPREIETAGNIIKIVHELLEILR